MKIFKRKDDSAESNIKTILNYITQNGKKEDKDTWQTVQSLYDIWSIRECDQEQKKKVNDQLKLLADQTFTTLMSGKVPKTLAETRKLLEDCVKEEIVLNVLSPSAYFILAYTESPLFTVRVPFGFKAECKIGTSEAQSVEEGQLVYNLEGARMEIYCYPETFVFDMPWGYNGGSWKCNGAVTWTISDCKAVADYIRTPTYVKEGISYFATYHKNADEGITGLGVMLNERFRGAFATEVSTDKAITVDTLESKANSALDKMNKLTNTTGKLVATKFIK